MYVTTLCYACKYSGIALHLVVQYNLILWNTSIELYTYLRVVWLLYDSSDRILLTNVRCIFFDKFETNFRYKIWLSLKISLVVKWASVVKCLFDPKRLGYLRIVEFKTNNVNYSEHNKKKQIYFLTICPKLQKITKKIEF